MNKIDSCQNDAIYCTTPTMKPVYSINDELMCGVIQYNNKTFLLDLKDKYKIINFNKTFVFANEDELYPSYASNYKRFSYLDFIFSYSQESVHYIFKNGNPMDIRRCNVEIYHFYHKNVLEQYNVIEYTNGHYLGIGQDANVMKNPMWKIKENENEYLLMYCEKETICKICSESYKIIVEFEINFNNVVLDKHYNKYKCTFVTLDNITLINQLKDIEIKLLKLIEKPNKIADYKLAEQLNNGSIKINADYVTNTKIQLVLKISGIWETETHYGLTYKFLYTLVRLKIY